MTEPIDFKYRNKILVCPPPCEPLSVFTDGEQCISCWQLSWKERLKTLIYGKVWLFVMSGETQPPVWIECERTVLKEKDDGIAD